MSDALYCSYANSVCCTLGQTSLNVSVAVHETDTDVYKGIPNVHVLVTRTLPFKGQ